MFRNYFKIAWRNLSRNKTYSIINIAGLTIGLSACLLVAMVVIDELSYDKQWKNAANIYRIISIDNNKKDAVDKMAVAFSGLSPALKKDFPEVKDYCRMRVNKEQLQLNDKDESISVKLLSSEPSVWNILNFKIAEGNPQHFIKGYANLVITEKMKQTYFPNTDPVGKTIQSVSSFGDPKQYIITGVIANIPSNTHLASDALLLHEFNKSDNELNGDYGTFLQQYVLLKPGTNITAFTSKVNNWYQNDILKKKSQYVYQFQPITDVYLRSDFSKDSNSGSIQNVYIFSGVAALLLLIACINFINLTTARALKRVKETGIRKVIGAGRQQLVAQFLCESLLFFIIAFILSLLLYIIFLPAVENYLGHSLAINLLNNITLIAATSGVVLLVSLFTGLYPAWLLSGSQPVNTIKGKLATGFGAGLLRKSLVTGQFIISAIVLLAAIIVQYQLHFLNHKDLGFNKNNLFKTEFESWDNKGNYFKQQVANFPSVKSVSITGWTPDLGGGSMSTQVTDPTDTTNKIGEWYIQGDVNLAKTLQLQLQKGRWLSADLATDAPNADSMMQKDFAAYEAYGKTQPVLITAYTAKLFHITALNTPDKNIQGIPVGIVKDFNNESLHTKMKPCIIRAASGDNYGYMMVRVKPGSEQSFLKQYSNLWQQVYPEKLFQYHWVADELAAQYSKEQKLQQLFTFFSCLAILLACLGLFGLTAFTAEQRTKEIGIRKVLGATVQSIMALLSKELVTLVCIAVLIASPVALLVMNKWLQNYAYRIHISWWIFAIAAAILFSITLITVSYQTIKAAIANPAKSLRTE